MAKGYRYSLVFEGYDGKLVYLWKDGDIVKNTGRKKFPLSQIDAFTTRLNDDSELRKMFEYFLKEDLGAGNFYVEYVQDKKKKRLEVAYKNRENLAYFSRYNMGKNYVDIDVNFKIYVINLLGSFSSNRNLYDYLIENKCINKYVLDKIKKYFEAKEIGNEEYISYAFKEIKKSLTNYRVIRNIEDGISDYYKICNLQDNTHNRLFLK